MKIIVSLVTILSTLAFHTMVVFAEDVPEALGSFPAPSWQTVDDPEVQSTKDVLEIQSDRGRQVVYELLPKGQTDLNWRKRHWVFVADDVSRSVLKVRNNFLNRSSGDCAKDQKWADWDKDAKETLFVVFCGQKKSDGLGYVGVIWMGKTGRTLVRVSEEWRGEPYAFGDSSTYFWNRQDLTDLIASMGSVELN